MRAPTPRMPTVRGQAYYEHLWRFACAAGQAWGHNTTAYRCGIRCCIGLWWSSCTHCPGSSRSSRGKTERYNARALAGILPEQTRTRRTKGGPDQAIYEGLRANRDVYELLTARPLIAQRGYVDQTAWRTAVQAAQFGHVGSAAGV